MCEREENAGVKRKSHESMQEQRVDDDFETQILLMSVDNEFNM